MSGISGAPVLTRISKLSVAAGAALTLLFAIATPARAQGASAGVMGGMNVTEINVSGNESLNINFVQQPAWIFGGFASFPASELLSVEIDALLSQKGSQLDIDNRSQSIRTTYLDFPLVLRFGVMSGNGPHVHVLGGTYFGFLLDAARSNVGASAATPHDDIQDAFRQYDFGWVAGFGLGVGRVQLDVRYSGGVLNLAAESNFGGIVPRPVSNDKFRNRGFSFLGGYRF